MSEENFENEVLQRLARIEAHQENMSKQCAPCQLKINDLEIQVTKALESSKAAHHRIDSSQADRTELKKDLTETIKDQIKGIYRTAVVVGAVVSFIIGVIFSLITVLMSGHG